VHHGSDPEGVAEPDARKAQHVFSDSSGALLAHGALSDDVRRRARKRRHNCRHQEAVIDSYV
jgi:hypothetical protein